jgi:hypothetical protein
MRSGVLLLCFCRAAIARRLKKIDIGWVEAGGFAKTSPGAKL